MPYLVKEGSDKVQRRREFIAEFDFAGTDAYRIYIPG